jgi:hypothetical protein
MGVFYPSTQHHYHRLILLLILPHVSVVRPSSGRNMLLARITQLANNTYLSEDGRTNETSSSISSKINLR